MGSWIQAKPKHKAGLSGAPQTECAHRSRDSVKIQTLIQQVDRRARENPRFQGMPMTLIPGSHFERRGGSEQLCALLNASLRAAGREYIVAHEDGCCVAAV